MDISEEPTLHGILCTDECWGPAATSPSFIPRFHSSNFLQLIFLPSCTYYTVTYLEGDQCPHLIFLSELYRAETLSNENHLFSHSQCMPCFYQIIITDGKK